MTPAEHHAILIAKAIQEARTEGVNVHLDWDDSDKDFDGSVHVSLTAYRIERQPSGYMKVIDGPFLIEGY